MTLNASPSRLHALGCGVLLLAVAYIFFTRLIVNDEDDAYAGFALLGALMVFNALPYLGAVLAPSPLRFRLVKFGLVCSLSITAIGLLVLLLGFLSLGQYDGQQQDDLRSSHIEGVVWLLAISTVTIGANYLAKRLART